MIKQLSVMLLIIGLLSIGLLALENPAELKLDKERASKFAAMALRCIEREYPNKPSHVMQDEKDI